MASAAGIIILKNNNYNSEKIHNKLWKKRFP